jgi:hypothetical protein
MAASMAAKTPRRIAGSYAVRTSKIASCGVHARGGLDEAALKLDIQ